MRNLRKGRPAGRPAGLGPARGRIVFVSNHPDGGKSIFFHDGQQLRVLQPNGSFISLCALNGEIGLGNRGHGAHDGQPFVEFSCGDTTVEARFDGEIWHTETLDVNPADGMLLRVVELATVRHVISSRKLKGSYGQGSTTLDADDTAALTADLLAGVAALEAKARTAGGVIHPRIVRARALDASGCVIAEGMPVLLMPPSGLTSSFVMAVSSADGSTGDIELTAKAWKAECEWVGGQRPWRVARMEVVGGEPLSPVDPKALLTCRRAGLATVGPRFEVGLPGMPLGQGTEAPLVPKIESALKDMMAPKGNRCTICPRRCTLPAYRRCRLDARPGRIATNGTLSVAVAPLRRIATCVSPLNHCIATDDARAWTATVATTFRHNGADRSRKRVERRSFAMSAMLPVTLSPLVVIPDSDAESHTIAVNGYGGVTLPMTPADGYSYHLAPDLLPIALKGDVPAVGAANPAAATDTEAGVAVSEATAPAAPLSGIRMEAGTRVLAVTPAARSRSTWDFGRAHFYLFTSAGIYAMAVNAARTRVDTSLVDPRVVNGPDAVAVTPRGVMAASGNTLLLITGTSATDAATLDGEATALGWDNSRGELRMVMADGSAAFADATFAEISETDFVPDSLTADGGALYAVASNTVYRIDAPELMRQLTEVEWEQTFETPAGKRPVAVKWDVTGDAVLGTFDVTSDTGARMLRLNVDGRLVSPLSARFLAPRRSRLTARISAQVSADTIIRGVTLKFDK